MGKFNFIKTDIPEVQIIEPTIFGDDRGYFMETYHIGEFAAAGIDKPFVQDNQSRSTKGVLRGLHFQKQHTQGKLVRVTMGRSLTSPWTAARTARPLENGWARPSRQRISGCSGSPRALPTAFWF